MRQVLEVKAYELRVGDVILDHGRRREVISLSPDPERQREKKDLDHILMYGCTITTRTVADGIRKLHVTNAGDRGNPAHWRISREVKT